MNRDACQSKSHRWSQYDAGVRHCKDCGQIDACRAIQSEAAQLEARALADGDAVAWQQRQKNSFTGEWSEWYPSGKDAFDDQQRGELSGAREYEVRALYTHPAPLAGEDGLVAATWHGSIAEAQGLCGPAGVEPSTGAIWSFIARRAGNKHPSRDEYKALRQYLADTAAALTRLRRERDEARKFAEDGMAAVKRESERRLAASEATVLALREALTEISEMKPIDGKPGEYLKGWNDARYRMSAIARAALEQAKP